METLHFHRFEWFRVAGGSDTAHLKARHAKAIEEIGNEAEVLFVDAARLFIQDQIDVDIDIVTDGELHLIGDWYC